MRPKLWFAFVVGLLVLGSCEVFNAEAAARRMRESDAFAQAFVRDLHEQGFASVRDRIDPSALPHFAGSGLRDLRVALPARIDSMSIAETIEFEFEDGYVVEKIPYLISGHGKAMQVTIRLTERRGVRRVDTIWWDQTQSP
ncbi:MAG TPA: hypothetical protein VF625_02335 [Longimicrobium sp.]|jgi:hypothetical protein